MGIQTRHESLAARMTMWLDRDYDRWLPVLAILTLILGLATVYGAFIYAPTDSIQGDVQRIFYIHAPIATFMEVAGGVVALAGLLYLMTRRPIWDVIARCSAEICLLLTTIVLVTGSIWGKVSWGVWWAWDARLTFTLVLWFIFAGYLMLRSYIGEPAQAARYAAVFGIIGALDIPLIHVAVEWWRTLHPQGVIDNPSGPALPGSMLAVFGLGMLTMLLLYLLLLGLRVRLELLHERVLAIEEHRLDEIDERAVPALSPSSEQRSLEGAGRLA
ncbi:MAG: cytochrome c biogenesis protein CcsA [Dehalococcoidia bacterium]